MKSISLIIIGFLVCTGLPILSFGECETNEFITSVNSAWSASNYSQVKLLITNRISACSNDILAKGLLYEYYNNIDVDFYSARNSAIAFVASVSNRMPNEVLHKRAPLELALLLIEMPIPTNFPPSQAKTSEQMQQMHYWHPDTFPDIELYQMLLDRINAVESGNVTDQYYAPLNRD